MPLQSQIAELDAAVLQAAVTMGLTTLAAVLYRRYRKPYFAWFTVAFGLYVLRLGVIIAFVLTDERGWLYWHQVATGWTALALLWAALLFSQPRPFSVRYGAALLFPVIWSYVAIYVLDSFLWAALPAVIFLSLVTAWTGIVFMTHWKRTHVPAAAFLGTSLVLWAAHHLDYPFLRARGAWVPWGYYLDIAFLLLVGTGLVFLVLDDLRGGLRAMMALAEPARARGSTDDVQELLRRAATLPAATGAAIFSAENLQLASQAIGDCASWSNGSTPADVPELIREVAATDRPRVRIETPRDPSAGARVAAYRAALPIPRATAAHQVLVVVGESRHPFTALDDEFLVALGRQIGSALDSADLNARLMARTEELSRLSVRMIQQHEEERRRLSLELHDETAQVFSAVKLQLGVLGERATGETARGIAAAAQLVDQGMRSIRSVTEMLRPAVLDDLGLEAALRSLALEFEQTTGIEVRVTTAGSALEIPPDAELGLFRAMQEGLSNVVRHAGAHLVRVRLDVTQAEVRLAIADDGAKGEGLPDIDRLQREGHMGLAGMRDRAAALGGRLSLAHGVDGGMQVTVEIPLRSAAGAA
ncbi:MAG: sensor histidine kinase [Gemmatimonadaceae bacterium]